MDYQPKLAEDPPEHTLDPERWVDAYGDHFFRYARTRLRNPEAAEEVVQETFLAGVRYHAGFQGKGSEAGWLMSILKSKIIDRIRERNRILEQSWGGENDPTALLFDEQGNWRPNALPKIDPGQGLEASELWQIVKQCLAKIPQLQADVFVLNAIEGMDSKEICKELGISASNMWVRLHRARLGLAKCVGNKWFSERE